MLLFIEGYPYNLKAKVRDGLTVKDALSSVISVFKEKEENYAPEYVGYCYSKTANDVIFFLPKVVLTGEKDEDDADDTIFGAKPEDIIDFEDDDLKKKLTEQGCRDYKDFLSNLSIWIYRTISVYKSTNHDSTILEPEEILTVSVGRKTKHNTLLDVIIALRDFNRNNQDFFTFIARNMHTGYNKIQWAKTIAKSQAIIQNGSPIYLHPVNKKRVVNFDEELLVIYFSILNYIHKVHGFLFEINFNYPLISSDKIKGTYIDKKFGCRRLKQIKYKYFSDKALRIWDLCYAFFDREYMIAMNRQEEDYLLARDFEHIFEMMIDTLISGNDKDLLPNELTSQKDGKLVDHMFIGQSLIEQSDLSSELTYYIGDSKYYKRAKNDSTNLGSTSIYKQYTYARNVIQWNMNLFLGLEKKKAKEQPQLRDELTEGYNPIPNFFISAHIPNKENSEEGKFLSFDEPTLKTQKGVQLNRQFENRLFDRDTLLLCHYNVNFLYVISLYGRNNKEKQAEWRNYARKEFRTRIQNTLNELYSFYTLQPREGMDCYQFIQDNFRNLNGKIYRPRAKSNYLILALMKKEAKKFDNIFDEKTEEELVNNDALINNLKSHFHVSKSFKLEKDFKIENIPDVGTLEKMDEEDNNEPKDVLLGCIRSEEQLKWVEDGFYTKYNIRLMTPQSDREGAMAPTKELLMVKYLLLYEMFDGVNPIKFTLYKVTEEDMIPSFFTYEDMKKTKYQFEKNPKDDITQRRYLVYENIEKIEPESGADVDNLLSYIKTAVDGQQTKGAPELVSYKAISDVLYHQR
jgi:hypothetical protein